MRTYDIAVTSLAIDAPQKWTDNLLAQHSIPDVVLKRRGVTRKIPHCALLRLALIRELNTTLNLGIREAVSIAARLWVQEGEQQLGVLRLSFDRAELIRTVERRLRDALESAPAPRRGRPPRPRAVVVTG
jgi:hypothetical protein